MEKLVKILVFVGICSGSIQAMKIASVHNWTAQTLKEVLADRSMYFSLLASDKKNEIPLFPFKEMEKFVYQAVASEILSPFEKVNDSNGSEMLLATAAALGNEEAVELLLMGTEDLEKSTRDGETPLYLACSSGSEYSSGRRAVVDLLLKAGANTDSRTLNSSSPLHAASQKGYTTIVDLLLKKNADPNSITNEGITPLHLAAAKYPVIVDKLLKAGAYQKAAYDGIMPLHVAVQNDCKSTAKLLRKKTVDIDACAADGMSPLALAAYRGCVPVAEVLMETGANADKVVKSDGSTPLCIAAYKGHVKIIELLLNQDWESFAHVDKEKNDGTTPLAIAAALGHDAVVEVLLKAKANADLANKTGKTPVFLAAENGHPAVVQRLLDAKVNIDIFRRKEKRHCLRLVQTAMQMWLRCY